MLEDIIGKINYQYILWGGLKLIFAFLLTFFLILLARAIAQKIKKHFIEKNNLYYDENTEKIGELIKEVVFYILALLCIQVGFYVMGIDIGWLSGGVTLAIGIILGDLIKNIISGMIMLTSSTYKLGRFLTIQPSKEIKYSGKLTSIDKRYSTLTTIQKEVIIVPNRYFIFYPIKMITGKMRLSFSINVNHNSDIDGITTKIIENINKLSFIVDQENTKVLVKEILVTGITLTIWCYFKSSKKINILKAKSDINTTILNTMKEFDIHSNYNEMVYTFDENDKTLLTNGLFLLNKLSNNQKNKAAD